MRSYVVTGTSSGIGRATARLLVGNGHRVFGVDIDGAGAATLEIELGDLFVPLLRDITDARAVEGAADYVRKMLDGKILCGLVNNAGIEMHGPLLDASMEAFERQIEVDLIGTVRMMKAFAPLLGYVTPPVAAAGRIVNVTAMAARVPPPFFAGLAAANAGIEAMSLSLRRELKSLGIEVVIVRPGITRTPMWDGAGRGTDYLIGTPLHHAMMRFSHMVEGEGARNLEPEQVAEKIHTALTVADPKPVYTVVSRPFWNFLFPLFAPVALVDRMVAANLGEKK